MIIKIPATTVWDGGEPKAVSTWNTNCHLNDDDKPRITVRFQRHNDAAWVTVVMNPDEAANMISHLKRQIENAERLQPKGDH